MATGMTLIELIKQLNNEDLEGVVASLKDMGYCFCKDCGRWFVAGDYDYFKSTSEIPCYAHIFPCLKVFQINGKNRVCLEVFGSPHEHDENTKYRDLEGGDMDHRDLLIVDENGEIWVEN